MLSVIAVTMPFYTLNMHHVLRIGGSLRNLKYLLLTNKRKMKKNDLFRIRRGLDLLNGIKNYELGMRRAKVAQIIDPEIDAMKEGVKNEEFERFRQGLVGKTPEELAKAERDNANLLEGRRKQLSDYEADLINKL